MNDDSADLDRLFTRLSGEGRAPDPDHHPAPERLSAYLANELSPEEDDAVQEHLAHCTLCTELLLDLQRFLDPPWEDLPREGLVDFETVAEWRELRGRMGEAGGKTEGVPLRRAEPFRRVFGSLKVAYGLAAVLAVFLGWTSYRMVSFEEELSTPITDLQTTTIEAQGTKRGGPTSAELQPHKLGQIFAFEIFPDRPYTRYRLDFRDGHGQVLRSLVGTQDADGKISMFLPRRFVAPGFYKVEVLGLEGAVAHHVQDLNIRISQ